MFTALRFAVILLLLSAVASVAAYQTEVKQELLTQNKTRIPVRYYFEWEIYDADLYDKSGADKAEIQDRTQGVLNNLLRDYAGKTPESGLIRLANGEDAEQTLAIAIETNKLIAAMGVRLIDLEFLSIDDD